ncbi:DUF4176 domain-containing protein [Pseudolactococcus yaeyamensis]
MSKDSKLLPLGTAVSIKDDDSKYVIVARIFRKQETGEMTTAYRGIPHPYGDGGGYKKIVIEEKAITKVEHSGYEDDLDNDFSKQQLEKAGVAPKPIEENVATITQPKASTSNAVSTTPPIQEKTELEYPNDPFYKLRKRKLR